MSYCNLGDKPTLFYQFGNASTYSQMSFDVSPIDVTVTNLSSVTGNYNPQGFQITIYSTNNFSNYVTVVRDYQIVNVGGSFPYVLYVQPCSGSGLISTVNVDPTTLEIDNTVHCPTPVPAPTPMSKISVSYQGSVIWTATGISPCTYSVVCNSGCPPGQCQCYSSSYPGYCCLDCNQILSEIAAITALAKSKGK